MAIIYDNSSYLYDSYLVYDAIGYIQQLSVRANIRGLKTLEIKGRIRPTLIIRTRIQRRQGWPVAELEDPGYLLWQDTRIYTRGKIYSYLAFPIQTIKLKSNITYGKTYTINAQARIVSAGRIQIRAHILPRFFTTSLPAYFSVQQTVAKSARVQFTVSGDYRTPTFSSQARIIKTSKTRVTGHFIVPLAPVITNNVMIINDPVVLARVHQTLSIRSKIT